MCCCGKSNVNGTLGYQWQPGDKPSVRAISRPETLPDDVVLADEPGRCGRGLDCHCHHFTLVKRWSGLVILCRNGAGDEAVEISDNTGTFRTIVSALSGDDLYFMLWTVFSTSHKAARNAHHKERRRWEVATINKRVKVRRRNGQSYVEIRPIETAAV